MNNAVIWVVVFFIFGLILGLWIAWLYWRQRTKTIDNNMHSLQRSFVIVEQREQNLQKVLKDKETSISQLRIRVRELEQAQHSSLPQSDVKTPVMQPSRENKTAIPEKFTTAQPDDLKQIEGIGPKISSVLNEAGITTFSELAKSSDQQLKLIIQKAGIKLADTRTWPEQATLAATNDWDGLANLQDNLKGGRRM